MQTKKSGHVFVSYASEDSEFALRLVRDLKAAGLPVWVDQHDLKPGVVWDDVIPEALKESQTVMVVLSPHAVKSPYVSNEIAVADEARKRIVPVMLRECPVPFRLARIQYCDFARGYDESLPDLIAALTSGDASCAEQPNEPEALVDAQSKHARNTQSLAVPATVISLFASTSKRVRSFGLVVAMAAAAIAGALWLSRQQNQRSGSPNPPLAPVPSAVPLPPLDPVPSAVPLPPKTVDLADKAAHDLLAGDWERAVMGGIEEKNYVKEEGGLFGGDRFNAKRIPREQLVGLDAAQPGIEADVSDDAQRCGKSKYLCQLYVTTIEEIVSDEILVVSFAARCISPKCMTEFGFNRFDPEKRKVSGTMIPGLRGEFEVGQQWTHCKIPFRAPDNYDKGTAAVMIRLGLTTQKIQIASLALKAYGRHDGTLPAPECPETLSNRSGK